MRLLFAPRLRVRLTPTGGRLATVAYLLTLAVLELTGRGATSDLHDLLAGSLFLFATAVLLAQHRRQPLPWLSWLFARVRRLGGRLAGWKMYHLGTDLRGIPVLPDRLPGLVWGLAGGLAALAGVAELLWAIAPTGWRTLGTRTLYTPYLVGVLFVWLALIGLVAAGVAGPVYLLDRRLRGRVRAADRRPAMTLALLGYLLFAAAVSVVLPAVLMLGLVLLVTAAGFGYAATVPAGRPGVLWRAGADGVVHSVPARRLVGVAVGLAGLAVFALLLAACGGRLVYPPRAADPMAITGQLGGLAAWLLPGLLVAATLELLAQRKHDPANRTPPTATVHPNGRSAEVEAAVRAVRRWGWRADVTPAVGAGEVGVALVAPERSEATEFDPRWPLAVSVDDLLNGTVRERLQRRDEVQLRRQVFRGLAVLLKRASRGQSGGGVWFAPHWWFNGGLLRDRPAGSKPGPPRRVGPAFARVYSLRTIQHLHAVLRAVAVDLVFVEDGVSRKQFDRVLRAVFELYDVHGGERPAEDRHFLGLPRVRVMVHEYAPGAANRAGTFRQPKFDDLTRARVLHVFRDDDGVPADERVPHDISWEPSPALGVG